LPYQVQKVQRDFVLHVSFVTCLVGAVKDGIDMHIILVKLATPIEVVNRSGDCLGTGIPQRNSLAQSLGTSHAAVAASLR